jgi:hypothetical protein
MDGTHFNLFLSANVFINPFQWDMEFDPVNASIFSLASPKDL